MGAAACYNGAAACYNGAAACYIGAAACYMMEETKIKLTQPSLAGAWAELGNTWLWKI